MEVMFRLGVQLGSGWVGVGWGGVGKNGMGSGQVGGLVARDTGL